MSPQDVITEARYPLNDTDSDEYRQSDVELLTYVNAGMKEISTIRPDLFLAIGDYTCIQSQCEQVITFQDAQRLVMPICIHGGAALTRFDISTIDTFLPQWRAATPAAATQWAQYQGDPLRFFIYPPAPASVQTLDIQYIKLPVTLLIGDTITEIPVNMIPALVDYVVFRASSKDDEHSDSGRAVASYGAFVAKIKGT
jgi:hypothetical protein